MKTKALRLHYAAELLVWAGLLFALLGAVFALAFLLCFRASGAGLCTLVAFGGFACMLRGLALAERAEALLGALGDRHV